MDTQLASVLEEAGYPTHTLTDANGTRLLILPHGGRVLGLFSGDNPRNFLWTNPRLSDAAHARELLSSDEWHNTGGDRTWLAPEVDFFFPRFPDTSVYLQPRVLDPGNYRLEIRGGIPTLTMECVLTPIRDGRPLSLRLSRTVETASDPLAVQEDPEVDLEYAGYSLKTTLEIAAEPAGSGPVGLWSLLQMPSGGEMILPARDVPELLVWFGEIASEDLRQEPNVARYRTGAEGAQKFGQRASSTTGRAGYYYEAGGAGHLIVRNFSVDPDGQYIDVPWENEQAAGHAVQVCNVNNEFGRFCELEYHVPAIGGVTGLRRSDDRSEVWAYRGQRSQLSLVAERLLGCPLR